MARVECIPLVALELIKVLKTRRKERGDKGTLRSDQVQTTVRDNLMKQKLKELESR